MNFKTLKPLVGIVFLWLLISCKIEPQAIEYGKDQCEYCVMNIVDKTHAAQLVSNKGKQFKFDAIECLVNYLNEAEENEMAFVLVANYKEPGLMINASSATFLISEGIKSPMGANLSALSSPDVAEKLQIEHTGSIYSWDELKQRLKDK